MALLAAAPSRRLRASFRRDQSFPRGGKPTGVRRQRTVAGGWTAPLAIISRRLWSGPSIVFCCRSERPAKRTRRTWIAAAVVAIVLLGGIATRSPSLFASVPTGFSWGTFSISASAVVFLIGISLLRRRRPLGPNATAAERQADDRRENLEISVFTAGLFVIAFVFACATWINPVAVGRFFGSMVVAYFALGAILALVNACRGRHLLDHPEGMVRSRRPAPRRRRLCGRLRDRPRGAQCLAASISSGAPL